MPCFSSLVITDLMTCSGLRILKSNESMSVEKMPILRSPRYLTISGGCRSAGKRKNGPTGLLPSAMLTAAMPFSISALASVRRQLRQILVRPGVRADGVAGRGHLLEDFGMLAGVLADREEHRLGALVGQRLEHALGVLPGHGPSSNVSTTSWSRRKS